MYKPEIQVNNQHNRIHQPYKCHQAPVLH
nr:hypothetical protein [Chlamydiota bacterium]